jgi:hypothetical protein
MPEIAKGVGRGAYSHFQKHKQVCISRPKD